MVSANLGVRFFFGFFLGCVYARVFLLVCSVTYSAVVIEHPSQVAYVGGITEEVIVHSAALTLVPTGRMTSSILNLASVALIQVPISITLTIFVLIRNSLFISCKYTLRSCRLLRCLTLTTDLKDHVIMGI